MPRKRTKAQRLLPDLADWSAQELRELQDMIQGLVEAKESGEAESEAEAPTRPDGSPIGKHGGQGHIELKMIPDCKTGKLYGPYRYLRYHSTGADGKTTLKSVYLGKAQGAGVSKS